MIVVTLCHDVPKVVQRERGKDGEGNILISSFPQLLTSVDIFPFGSEGQSWAFEEWVIHLQILDVFAAEEK